MFIHVGMTITEMRARLRWQQCQFTDEFKFFYEPVIYRVEKGEQLPRKVNLHVVFDKMGIPLYELQCPYREGQPMEVYPMMYVLSQHLDHKMLDEAMVLYSQLDKIIDKDYPINLQYMICQNVRIMELQDKPSEELIPQVIEALKLTMPDFDESSPGDKFLLLEESELFFTLARLYASMGKHEQAVSIIKDTLGGIGRQPFGERVRDRKNAQKLLDLCRCFIAMGNHSEALRHCDIGMDVSAKRSLGKEVPEFLEIKADSMIGQGKHQECESMLKQAYAGYLMLGEKSKSDLVLNKAREKYKMEFELYGMEKLDIKDVPFVPYRRGDVPQHSSIGELISKLRDRDGISLLVSQKISNKR